MLWDMHVKALGTAMPLILFAIFAVLAVYVAPPVVAAMLTVLEWAFMAVAAVFGLATGLLHLVPPWCILMALLIGGVVAILTVKPTRPKKKTEPFFVRRAEPFFTWPKGQRQN
jgi:hypothetical protein